MSLRDRADRDTRGRDATDIRQGLVGVVLVVGLAAAAAGMGWLFSLVVSLVY
ncbi:MAG: hypothetical protein KY457_09795 [Actinobacteria bacterium]|nr:hypothetical protein [Actinomycetota bacterium]